MEMEVLVVDIAVSTKKCGPAPEMTFELKLTHACTSPPFLSCLGKRDGYQVLWSLRKFFGFNTFVPKPRLSASKKTHGTDEYIQADNNNSKRCAIVVNKCHSTMMTGRTRGTTWSPFASVVAHLELSPKQVELRQRLLRIQAVWSSYPHGLGVITSDQKRDA